MSQVLLLCLTTCVAFGAHVAMTSPTPPAPKDRRVVRDFPSINSLAILVLKYACWTHAAFESAIIMASELTQNFPSSILTEWVIDNVPQFLLPSDNGPHIFLSSIRTIGGISVVVGSAIRYLCYRELGRLFTYQVSVLPKHKLVTTGPYSIVRHPAYIGGDFVQVGLLLWHASPGAWLTESGFYKNVAAWLVILPALYAIGSILLIYYRRPAVEDKALKKEFGVQWEEWAKRVPYRLVPGIY
ncbi:hypothetical protein BDN70DRAFT_877814 [Pholiota conissans]|uniref:Protein-S-isoprenylcysteine O-methyltransferase n=1 Tax=Pholiota conissans TaxID=109636 RepID=A0A9P5Z376_9AGAR|nr:hypothetical protein BDN70DRAFT_877814 [Pholiota conissans]